MPVSPGTLDTPSTATPFADVLDRRLPPLSAVSDMPQVDPLAEPVDAPENPDNTDGTSVEAPAPEGEDTGANPKPGEQTGGDKKPGDDGMTPQQKAAWTRNRKVAEAAKKEAEELRATVAKLSDAVAALTAQGKPKDDARPVRESFDSPEAHEQALEEWAGRRATEKALADAKAEQATQEAARKTAALLSQYDERKLAYEADHPDFDDVALAEDLQISPVMGQVIYEAEDGPAIAYYLGQNPAVAERISKLSPALAAAEIGRISAKLATPAPKPKPTPIRTIGARNNSGEKSPDDMSMDEYFEVSPNGRKRRTN